MQNAAQPFHPSYFPEPFKSDPLFPRRTRSTGHIEEKKQMRMLTAVEEKILFAVYKLPYLRIDQIARFLNKSHNSVEWLRKIMHQLIEREYLDIHPLPRLTSFGKLPNLYMLGTKGIGFYHDKGLPVSYTSPKERSERFFKFGSYGKLIHTLRVSECILAASHLSRYVPAIELTTFHHDLRITHTPLKVTVNTKTVGLHPDCILDWYLTSPYGSPGADRFTCFVEVDNNEEDCSQLIPKIAKYVSFLEGQIAHNPFGISNINAIPFLVCEGGLRRVRQLRDWIAKELERLGKQVFAGYFKVASLPCAQTCVTPALFLAPVFYALTGNTPMPLIEKLL